MNRIVRAVPIKSKEALMELARKVEEWPHAEKKAFLDLFGGAVEDWYYQEIEGNPFVIAIVEGEKLEEGFGLYPTLDDPYFNWFRDEVLELCNVDLRKVPTAAASEFIFRLHA